MNRHTQILDHLDYDFTAAVRDPLWGHIYLSPALEQICAVREFRQLAKIKQLGPTHIVYPGAVHSRLNHSLGVFFLARRLIRRLVGFPNAPALSLEGVKAYLAAALLHDLGHFPFTHSLKELPLLEHEQLTARLLCQGELAHLLREAVGVDPEMVAAIVDEGASDQSLDELRLFRRLLSGTLDPDKLDYLNRDAYYCGVPYGVQDIDFVLDRVRPNGYEGIALERDGISAVENILFSKYLMYRAVYWHKSVRAATAMIKKALHSALSAGAIIPDDLYGLDDESFTAQFKAARHPAFELIELVDRGRTYKAALELPYSEHEAAGFSHLLDLDTRRLLEDRCSTYLSVATGRPQDGCSLIIDLPEAVNFEVAFPISDKGVIRDYLDAGSVFTPAVVQAFTANLRLVRVFVDPLVQNELRPEDLQQLHHMIKDSAAD